MFRYCTASRLVALAAGSMFLCDTSAAQTAVTADESVSGWSVVPASYQSDPQEETVLSPQLPTGEQPHLIPPEPSAPVVPENSQAEVPGEEEPTTETRIRQLDVDTVLSNIREESIFSERNPVPVTFEELIVEALTHSRRIKVLKFQPAQERTEVTAEYGQFDWRAFVSGQLDIDNQPIGDLLQTAGLSQPFVRNDRNEVRFGLRKNTLTGGTLEVSEAFGTRDADSGLLIPPDQGTAQIRVVFSQELLRDRGKDIVLSRALLASLAADQTYFESRAQISNLLRDVLVAYWNLYEARGNYFVQQSLSAWAERALNVLNARREIDAETNSIEQARALLLEARADLATARATVLIAQDQLYRIINAPRLNPAHTEMVTIAEAQTDARFYDVDSELQIALSSRDEITQRLSEIREAALQYHVSRNQLLPRLTFSLEASVDGLDGNFRVSGAHDNLNDIDPSLMVGLTFEYPIRNRTARARAKQARLAMRELQFEYEDQIEQVRLEVSRAIRTANASAEILTQRKETLAARLEEIGYLRLRLDEIPGEGSSSALLLEQLFQAINRYVDSQSAFVNALANQQGAQAELLRAKGLLLSDSEVASDYKISVPSNHTAFQEQLQRAPRYKDEAYRRVINPIERYPIPVRR